jgi:MoaA/NifB/PqqE/SkfB family radical SAM enzyme
MEGSIENSSIISGLKARWIGLNLLIRILRLAILQERNILRALRIFMKVGSRRKKIHNLPFIAKFVKMDGMYFWGEAAPGYPSMHFDSFIKSEFLRGNNSTNGKIPLHTMIFAITNRCGLECKHCYEWDNLQNGEQLEISGLMKILKNLKNLGLSHIQFSGGEPLARFNDLLTLIEEAKSNMVCWILTSGYGLTKEKAFLLKKAGLTGANISLDHWQEQDHNNFRNNSKSFSWVSEAARNCRQAGIIVSLSLCATMEFISNENLYKYLDLARNWGAGFVRVLEPRKTGRFKDQDVMIGQEQIEILEKFYLETNMNRKFRNYPIVMYPGYHQRRVGCFGAGNRYFYIDSKGDVHACPFCQGAVGNALNGSLSDSIEKLKSTGCHEYRMNLAD